MFCVVYVYTGPSISVMNQIDDYKAMMTLMTTMQSD